MQTIRFRLFGFQYHAQPGFWLFLGVVMLFTLQGGEIRGAIIAPISVALAFIIHELGHAVAARALRVSVSPIQLNFMIGTTPHARTTPAHQFIISVAGPFAGFLLALLGLFGLLGSDVAGLSSPALVAFFNNLILTNVLLSGFNLLPIIPFDGGNALRSAVGTIWGETMGWKVGALVSVALGVALALFGLQNGLIFLTGIAGFAVWQNIQTLRELRVF